MALQRFIPTFETWSQCFALYAVVIISHDPSRAWDLMAYSHSIAAIAKNTDHPGLLLTKHSRRNRLASQVVHGVKKILAFMLGALTWGQ